MAIYNDGSAADTAIESILCQSYGDFELLVVDDASNDAQSRDAVERWRREDGRVKVVRNEQNLGLAASLNRGFTETAGRFIARMDADDVCAVDRLARQVEFLNGHEEVEVLGTWATLVDGAGNQLGTARPAEWHEQLAADIYRRSPFIHPTVMFRRGFAKRLGGYDPRLRRAQDLDLWLRGYRSSRYHNLQEPLLSYRVTGCLSTEAVRFGTYVLALNAYREGHTIARGVFALRFLVAGILARLGLVDPRVSNATVSA